MLPLIPLAISIAPEIAKFLFGSGSAPARVTAQVASAVQSVTGADPSTADGITAAQAALAGKPELAVQLRTKLAEIAAQAEADQRKADLAALQAQLADVASARAQTVALAKAGSEIAWGAPVVSLVVLGTFGVVMWGALTRALPPGSETILNVLLGTLAANATAVVSYWVGSSRGADKKDSTLSAAVRAVSARPPV